MKLLLALTLSLAIQGWAQTIDLPVKMTVTIPLPSNATSVVRTKLWMTNNVIAPVGAGVDLKKTIAVSTQFQLGAFPPDSSVTLFLQNTSSNKIVWPSGLVPMGAPLPTNSALVVVLFEEAFGRVLCYPITPFR